MIHWLVSEPLAVAVLLAAMLAAWVAAKRGGRLPPGPRGLPLVGYLPFLDPKAPHLSLAKLARGGGVIGVRLGSVYSVVVSEPALVREALSREEFAGRAPLYLTHGIMKGNGIICAEGDKWRRSRRFAASFLKTLGMVRFPGPRREALERRIMASVDECLQGFRSNLSGNAETEMDPLPEILHGMGNLMSDLVFGRTWKRDDPTWRWLQELQEKGTKLIGVAGPLNFLPFLRFIPYYKRTIEYLVEGKNQTHELYKKFILEHIEKREDCGLAESEDGGEERPHDAIDAYIIDSSRKDKKGEVPFDRMELASDTQLHHLLADLFGAGLDTTMATLRWFLLLMAVNPRAQDLVQEELDNLLGAPGNEKRAVTLDDAIHLPFTEAAIAETQRMRPVVPLGIPHGALKDTSLGGYFIPKGTMLIPLQWVLHNGEAAWGKDAHKIFDPTRFIDAEGNFSTRQKEHFMPFQTGRRVCVGEDLAHMFLFLFGVSILHEFRLSFPSQLDANDALEGDSGITLTPKPHTLMIRRRFV